MGSLEHSARNRRAPGGYPGQEQRVEQRGRAHGVQRGSSAGGSTREARSNAWSSAGGQEQRVEQRGRQHTGSRSGGHTGGNTRGSGVQVCSGKKRTAGCGLRWKLYFFQTSDAAIRCVKAPFATSRKPRCSSSLSIRACASHFNAVDCTASSNPFS